MKLIFIYSSLISLVNVFYFHRYSYIIKLIKRDGIRYNLNANEDFVVFFYFEVYYMFYVHSFMGFVFHSRNEIPINWLFTKEK